MSSTEQLKNDLTFDQVFKRIKTYGWYQVYFAVTIQLFCFCHAANFAGGLFSLGGLIPIYTCTDDNITAVYDKDFIVHNASAACQAIHACTNLTVENAWFSMYQEFDWVCQPANRISRLASFLPLAGAVGYMASGHLSDHFGRKWPAFIGICVSVFGGLINSVAPNWIIYYAVIVVQYLLQPMYHGAAFTLCMESVGSKWRIMQSFTFQYTLAFTYAGLLAYLTQNWRLNLAIVNALALPALVSFLFVEESPRWMVQKHRYKEAAKSVNKIARWNGRGDVKHTESDMKRIEMGSQAQKHHYNVFHLFSQKKLALYCLSQITTGICMSMITSSIMMNVQDLAGSPFLNISLVGLLRIWTPFAVIAMERYSNWFGRKPLFLGAQSLVFLLFATIIAIQVSGQWEKLHALATACALFGVAVEIGLVWVAYKTYTVELFPTVVRTIAMNLFSVSGLIGDVIAPQLIYLKYYWRPMPYAGAAGLCLLSILLGLIILPETKGKPMPDSLEEVKAGRLRKIDTNAAKELQLLSTETNT
uniref:Major facilitator superfamily (MFS) profile domain-containing protein n=1 Tax=Plectus sambesii TaxID=2011161 RepID=A0A914WLX5_9BILA